MRILLLYLYVFLLNQKFFNILSFFEQYVKFLGFDNKNTACFDRVLSVSIVLLLDRQLLVLSRHLLTWQTLTT